jgi:predicted CopG family antitoxin
LGAALKTIRVSDNVHQKLIRLLGERIAKTGKNQTLNDIIEYLIAEKENNH